MRHASAMITHAGFATTMLGVASGLPMVVMPLFALDQFAMARRIQAVGAGIELQDGAAAPERLRTALEQLLAGEEYGNAARRLRDEIAQLPPPSAAVAPLETLAQRVGLT